MSGKYLLGIDIGTQSIRTQIFDLDGNCIGSESKKQYLDTIRPGWATQKPEFWWKSVSDNIKALIEKTEIKPDEIASVGCCAIMHSPVPINIEGQVVEKDIQLYCDKRAAHIADNLLVRFDSDWLYNKTANIPTSNWFGIKLKWIKDNNPEVYENTYKFVTPNAYINYLLTGEACIDPSEASGTYLMDKDSRDWSEDIVSVLGLDVGKLPRICNAYDVIGTVTRKASEATGLAQGTPVVAGGGDTFCSLITSGLTKIGSAADITGTGSTITLLEKKPIMDKRLMNICHVMDGWVSFGCIDSSGGSLRWFRDIVGKKETEYARSNGLDEYMYLCSLAEKTEYGAQGVMFFPYLMGERTMGSAHSRAAFFGMNSGTTIGHMVRSIMEGIAFEHKRTLDILDANSEKGLDRICHNGGGAKGDFWSQIKADIYGIPVYTMKSTEGGVLGAAILGGVGVGIYGNILEATEYVTKIDKEYYPDKSKAERYEYMYERFCSMHDLLQDEFRKMSQMP